MKNKPVTRREVLSVVSSIYDPLGFVAPFVLVAKIIMQDVCWKNLSCNDVLQGDYLKRWKSWAGAVEDSTTLHPKMLQTTSIWTNYVDSIVHLFDKARVAPLKVITIPLLELSAAVVAK